MQQQYQRNEAQKSFLQASNQSEEWVASRFLFSSVHQPQVQKLPFANKSPFLHLLHHLMTLPSKITRETAEEQKHTDLKPSN